jgi:hypothetical protein
MNFFSSFDDALSNSDYIEELNVWRIVRVI